MSDQPQIDLFEAMRTSRSLRRLKPDPIPDEIIRAIIEAGTLAPSGSNIQNWIFMAVTDAEKRAALGDQHGTGEMSGVEVGLEMMVDALLETGLGRRVGLGDSARGEQACRDQEPGFSSHQNLSRGLR